jgi:hypothetical protein
MIASAGARRGATSSRPPAPRPPHDGTPAAGAAARLPGLVAFVPKPFSPRALRATVERVLARPPRPAA